MLILLSEVNNFFYSEPEKAYKFQIKERKQQKQLLAEENKKGTA
jgi:hypothetical protein